MIWVLMAAAFAGFVFFPFYQEARRKPVCEADVAATPGAQISLSQGQTQICWHGPARGPVIVAIHGLTTPSVIFDALAGYLGGLGYRVLTYDLYGRGLSDRVPGPQNAAYFLRQLDDVLADQNLDEDLIVMGYSMGGAIAAAFAAAQPHRIARLILLAPSGMAIDESRFWRIARRIPVLGDWLVAAFGANRLSMDVADGTPIGQAQRKELSRRGYLAAVLSSRRNFLLNSQEAAHRVLGRLDVPVLAIWGRQDKVIPQRAIGLLAQWNRNTVQEVVPDADHSLPWRHAEEVAEILRSHR